MSTRPTTPRRARRRTIAPTAHAMVTAAPRGLWIVTGHGKRARDTQRIRVVVEGAFPTPFGRRTRRPHAPQAQSSSVLSNRTSGVGSRRPDYDTDGRQLTDERRYAPTSIPLRRKPCSRSPETRFHFTGIPRRYPRSRTSLREVHRGVVRQSRGTRSTRRSPRSTGRSVVVTGDGRGSHVPAPLTLASARLWPERVSARGR